MISHPMHHEAALVLETLGGEAGNFAARQFTPKVASDADLVITMTKAHRDAVLELAPRLLLRTFTLAEASKLAGDLGAHNLSDLVALRPQLVAKTADIPDPMGHDREVFAEVGAQIADLLPPILELIRGAPAPRDEKSV